MELKHLEVFSKRFLVLVKVLTHAETVLEVGEKTSREFAMTPPRIPRNAPGPRGVEIQHLRFGTTFLGEEVEPTDGKNCSFVGWKIQGQIYPVQQDYSHLGEDSVFGKLCI